MNHSTLDFKLKKEHWLYRYKLYHLPFWALYHYFWWTMFSGDPIATVNNLLYLPHTIKFSFYVILQALSVYFCLYFLIPRFLEKGRYLLFLSLLISTILCTALLIVPGYYLSAFIAKESFFELYKIQPNEWLNLFKGNSFPSCISAMTLGMSIKLAKNWLEAQQQQRRIEKEKLETELKFLKSQFNPHFLFNTINSIFVLIDKNPVMASESLAKFSSLLRYQLYECNEAKIPLDREIAYLKSFMELERLRQNDNVNIHVSFPVVNTSNLSIAPFLIMPFIENAFKHVSKDDQQKNEIYLQLSIVDQHLHFEVRNSKPILDINAKEVVNYSGLGLKNVRRRLKLIYPQKHQLIIENEAGFFRIELQLELQYQEQTQATTFSEF